MTTIKVASKCDKGLGNEQSGGTSKKAERRTDFHDREREFVCVRDVALEDD